MKDNFYLGVNTLTGTCCIIDTPVALTKENISHIMKYARYGSTDRAGNDYVERTCELQKFKLTDETLPYDGEYAWRDYDHGHSYGGVFLFDEVVCVIREDANEAQRV